MCLFSEMAYSLCALSPLEVKKPPAVYTGLLPHIISTDAAEATGLAAANFFYK